MVHWNIDHYRARQKGLGTAYRDVMGYHYPAMTLLEVTDLANPDAIVEITATAVPRNERRSSR